jgi:hypothetical protein
MQRLAEPLFPVAATDTALTTDEWYTPRWLFKAAGITFDMDVCAPVDPVFRACPAKRYLTVLDDGLTAGWAGVIWCNPPYSNPAPWVDRWVTHPDGLMLVPATTGGWCGRMLAAADGLALITINGQARKNGGFKNPAGRELSYPVALILAARGAECVAALEPVARQDCRFTGAWFVRGHEPCSG